MLHATSRANRVQNFWREEKLAWAGSHNSVTRSQHMFLAMFFFRICSKCQFASAHLAFFDRFILKQNHQLTPKLVVSTQAIGLQYIRK
jgi:hypothetical protein